MHVQNLVYPLPLQIGGPTTFFRRFRNLTEILTTYIFGTQQTIDNRADALQTARGLLHRLKITRTLVHKRLKIGPEFSPALRQFYIAGLSTHTSNHRTQPSFATWKGVMS